MADKPAGRRTCLYSTDQLDAIVDDMARQAAGLLTGRTRIAIVGILRRGAPLADRLQARLAETYGLADCVRLDLMIKRYADDLTLLYPETRLTENPAHASLDLAATPCWWWTTSCIAGIPCCAPWNTLPASSRRKSVPWCWWTAARRNCRYARTSSACASTSPLGRH